MPMREDCKNYESRSYRNGETVRKCNLDLAPEAPWRCPADCPKFERRLADVNWQYGSLVTPPTPPEPATLGHDDSIATLLDEAEEIVNQAVPRVRAELDAERGGRSPSAAPASRRGLRGLLDRLRHRSRRGRRS